MQLGLGLTLGAQGSGTPPDPSVPVISSVTIIGTPTVGVPVGVIVSCTGYPPPTYTYAWKLDGTPIGGATGATYTPVEADVGGDLSCTVTATNSEGSAEATSAAVTVSAALAAPVNTVAPVISGDTEIPATLTATAGTWTGNPTPTITGQWRRDGVAISGETGSTYTTTAADEGADVDYQETATNTAGARSADSNDIAIPVGTGWNVSDNGDGTFDITSAPSAPAALIATDNGDGTFNLEAA